MEKQLELIPASVLRDLKAEKFETRKAKNWQRTLESINRNFENGNDHAWSDVTLELEQCEELEAAGYKVVYCDATNCHQIFW